jgi:hypothetical protein
LHDEYDVGIGFDIEDVPVESEHDVEEVTGALKTSLPRLLTWYVADTPAAGHPVIVAVETTDTLVPTIVSLEVSSVHCRVAE